MPIFQSPPTTIKAIGPFRLPEWIDPNDYVLTDSMAHIEDWRAKIYLANDSGKKNTLDQVGYVMISLVDKTIIPIARGDEHHQGYELLWHFKKKRKSLNPKDYYSFWPHGDNFLYDRDQIPKLLAAVTKFVAYGGPVNLKIRGSNDLRTRTTTLAAFLEGNGEIDPKPGHLAPLGQKVYDAFAALDKAVISALKDPSGPSAASLNGHAFTCAKDTLCAIKYLQHARLEELIENAQTSLNQLNKNDLDGLEKLFFGFHSVKNKMHQFIRDMISRRAKNEIDYWIDDDLVAIWGDVDLANDMLGKL